MNWLRLSTSQGFGWRDALLGAALFAAILRALIPAGFMPHAENGEITMVICTVDGARTIAGEPLGKSAGGDAMAAMQMPCAFAALAAMAPPPEAPVVSLALAIERRLVKLDERPAAVAAPPFRPQAPRAPPHLQA
jgi:hypothetical protein